MELLIIVLKNALRHKLRTTLTIIGVAVAVMAFGLLQTVVTAWGAGVDGAGANRLITRQAVSFIFPLPYAYKDRIRAVNGVQGVTWFNWFGGVYKDKSQFFARIACDPETLFDVYPDYVVGSDVKQAFTSQRNSCLIGEQLAGRFNLKVGDIMQLEGDIYPGTWQFVIAGIYKPRDKNVDASQMFFHWTYLDERLRKDDPTRAGNIGWFSVSAKSIDDMPNLAARIDALFANSPAETKSESERAFQQGFLQASGVIVTAIHIMSFVIIGIIMLVLCNTMIMSARERTREYAVLKTLGFRSEHLVLFISGEAMIISILGAALGVPILIMMVSVFEQAMPKGFFPVFYVAPATYALAIGAALMVGVIAAIFPIHRALRTRIVDGLRFAG